ncbi:hypothetical protein RHSIM_Rhsim05G0028300 [Rhododendron simsii]|uniref:Acid phosphatase n=1 Tax=Rhododendron simsii TaxID=118357 RepID=A0A834GXP0_RHOSS|nr:hypothetical protein RHSIM_Rhsim05G0028300 [Rhododendron simsii]
MDILPICLQILASSAKNSCESWRFSVETNDAGVWTQIPATCENYVKKYMNGHRYRYDSDVVAFDASAFAETVNVSGDGMDACVFDIDETLLSNLPYYATVRYGLEEFNQTSWDKWVDLAEAPALPASLKLYKEVQQLGFTLFLLTGREESQRNVTMKNLKDVGYSNWERLILRYAENLIMRNYFLLLLFYKKYYYL